MSKYRRLATLLLPTVLLVLLVATAAYAARITCTPDTVCEGSPERDIMEANYATAVYGLGGDDEVNGTLNARRRDELHGGAGADTVGGREGNDLLYGDGGADTMGGFYGNDRMFGGSGNDIMHADDPYGAYDDLVRGEDGVDSIDGHKGDDRLYGGPDGDRAIDGGDGADTIYGGGGDDWILGGLTNSETVKDRAVDTIDCGPGYDEVNNVRRDQDIVAANCEKVIYNETT